ncbi:LysR family transcriptional regulator [Granulosicoccus sp.]|nr:LysR family transcriptional regulator [Granulosicoccus sp.]
MDKNLAAFLAVAQEESLTQAADRLFVTQPTLSKRIANLESEIGARLFHRERRGMRLTDAGKVFLRRAVRIESEYRQSQEEVNSITSAGLSLLRVGAGPLFHLNWVAKLFSKLRLEFPETKLELRTDKSVDNGKMLSDGVIDVYLGIVPKEQLTDSIYVKYLTTVEHGIILRKDNPLAKGTTIDAVDLQGMSWVSFLYDEVTESRLLEYSVPKDEQESLIDIRTTSFATGLQLVGEGQFVMSAPLQLASIVEKEGLVIRRAKGGMPQRKAGLYLRKSTMEYRCIRSVINYFEQLTIDL